MALRIVLGMACVLPVGRWTLGRRSSAGGTKRSSTRQTLNDTTGYQPNGQTCINLSTKYLYLQTADDPLGRAVRPHLPYKLRAAHLA